MDRRPNCNRGQPIPIFTNNKTKRLRQALFASPSKAEHSKDLEDFSIVTSLNSHKEWNDRDDCFETYDTGPQKQNFPLPQKSNSDINVGNMDDRPPSVCFSTRQSHYSLNGLGYIGNNQKGLQVPIYQHGKRESQLHHSYSIVSACPNFTSFNYKDVRTLQYETRNQDKTKQSRSDDACISPQLSVESSKQEQCNQSKEKSTKQLNLMASPTDKSFKVITATIQSILKWKEYKDKVALLYESFGILDSQVALNSAGNGKNFVIKDNTGHLRYMYMCTFWEMDRQLPRLTRGQMHRCVGYLDRKRGNFNCVSVRPVKQTELQAMMSFLQASQRTMQQQLAALKED